MKEGANHPVGPFSFADIFLKMDQELKTPGDGDKTLSPFLLLFRWLCVAISGLCLLCAATYAELPAWETRGFYRLVSPDESVITALDVNGKVVWSNQTVGATGTFQRAATVGKPVEWTDYVQCVVTAHMMTTRIFDPSPPDGMAFIPGGINVGTDPDFGDYVLSVGAFYMDRAHVTKDFWEDVRAWGMTNGYADLSATQANGDMRRPVDYVSWYDAVKWCNARSEREGRPVAYRINDEIYRTGETEEVFCEFAAGGYRLPTVEEWQYAARGGLRGKRYPWGDEIDGQKANYSYFVDETTVAGVYPANAYDLYDMAGNLWQWAWDWHPANPFVRRSHCGGSWKDQDYRCRIMHVEKERPHFGHYTIGFRTILPISETAYPR